MIASLAVFQQDILQFMVKKKDGMDIKNLSQSLKNTRNAAWQYPSGMERNGLIMHLAIRPPENVF